MHQKLNKISNSRAKICSKSQTALLGATILLLLMMLAGRLVMATPGEPLHTIQQDSVSITDKKEIVVGFAARGDASPTQTPTPTPIPLSNDTPVIFSEIPRNFSFSIHNHDWCGVGIYPTTDHDIQIDNNSDFSSPYASSTFGASTRDFVVSNGHQWGDATHYAQVYYGSPSNYTIEAEWDIPNISVGSRYSGTISRGEVLDMCEITLSAGQQYTLEADVSSGDVDLAVFIFKADRQQGSRSDADWDKNSTGSGGDESITFTTDRTGDHGIALINENDGSGEYSILVSTPTPTPT